MTHLQRVGVIGISAEARMAVTNNVMRKRMEANVAMADAVEELALIRSCLYWREESRTWVIHEADAAALRLNLPKDRV